MDPRWRAPGRVLGWLRRVRRVVVELWALLDAALWLRSAHVFVVVGTGAVDDMAVRSPWDAPYDLLRWCAAARLAGARVVFLSVGVGPIVHPLSRRLMLAALRLAHVRSYRETAAATFLEAYGFDTWGDRLTPDLVFSLDVAQRALPAVRQLPGSGLRVGLGLINYRGWQHDAQGEPVFRTYIEQMKSFVHWLLEQGCSVRLLVGDATDAPCLQEVLDDLQRCGPESAGRVIAEPIVVVDDLFAQIAQTDIVVASRFHNVLCAMLMERPVVSVGYHDKNDQLMASMGLGAFCQRIDGLDLELLKQHFDACAAQRDALADGVRARLGELRALLDLQYWEVFLGDKDRTASWAPLRGASQGLAPIVMAADENFAMPLSTAIRSLIDSNRAHWPLDITVLTDGFADASRRRVEQSLPAGSAVLKWREIDTSAYDKFSMAGHLTRMTFARLQLDLLFSPHVSRVIYLDSDTLVLDDIGPLSRVELGNAVLGAVADASIDTGLRSNSTNLPAAIPRVEGYFNAGVLVIDMEKWRGHNVARRALSYLAEHPTTPYADQDALNWVCQRSWADIGKRWNFQDHRTVRINKMAANEKPAIVHFVTAQKPWKPASMSLNASLYETYRDRTQFRRGPPEKFRAALETLVWRAHRKGTHLLSGRGFIKPRATPLRQ